MRSIELNRRRRPLIALIAFWTAAAIALIAVVTWVRPTALSWSGGRTSGVALIMTRAAASVNFGEIGSIYSGGASAAEAADFFLAMESHRSATVAMFCVPEFERSYDMVSIRVPLLIPFALAIAVWILARRRKALKNQCVKCGYDLTGNVSGRCPECGTALTLAERNAEDANQPVTKASRCSKK